MTNSQSQILNSGSSHWLCPCCSASLRLCVKSPTPLKMAKNPQNHSNRLSMNHLPSMRAIFQSYPVKLGQSKNQSGPITPVPAHSRFLPAQSSQIKVFSQIAMPAIPHSPVRPNLPHFAFCISAPPC